MLTEKAPTKAASKKAKPPTSPPWMTDKGKTMTPATKKTAPKAKSGKK